MMRSDLENLGGSWNEVAAYIGSGDWRNQLAVLAGYDQEKGQTESLLKAQIEPLAVQKGYCLEDIRLEYDRDGEEIQSIGVVVSEMEDYIYEPVIWRADEVYTDSESGSILEQYLNEIIKPASDVELYVVVR